MDFTHKIWATVPISDREWDHANECDSKETESERETHQKSL